MKKITIEDMLHRNYCMVAIEPRYTPARVCVVLGPQQQHFFDMVDTLTDGGDEPMQVERIMMSADFFPYGYGDTMEEAMAQMLERLNRICDLPEEKQEYAWLYIHNISSLPKGVTTYHNVPSFEDYYKKESAQ